MTNRCILICLTAWFIPALLTCAESTPTATSPSPTATTHSQKEVEENIVVTDHAVKINGANIAYKATAGTLVLKNDGGNSTAAMFYVSYTKEGVEDIKSRPVTFCFNGGPGSSSIWLHLGVLGPKCVDMNEEGTAAKQPYQLLDNPYSILDVTDLVFIDPVSTGYSRSAPGEDAKQFHGVEEDVKSVAEFIRLYTTRHERWQSPKFLAGESYGTTRAAALALELHDSHHLYLNGIMLISSVLNFQTISFTAGNDLPYILFLPSYTATAWYHKKLPADLQKLSQAQVLEKAEHFASQEYASALLQGDRLPEAERKQIIEELSRYTGLSNKFVDLSNLRVSLFRFSKELLHDDRRTTGRFDSRLKGINSDLCLDTFEFDPSYETVAGLFTATFNDYVRKQLGWKSDEEYQVIADVRPWNYNSATNQFLDVASKLKDVMCKNNTLKVYVASGFNDMATPYYATDYTFSHLSLDPILQPNITVKKYQGGHMMYLYKPTLVEMKRDLAEFVQQRLQPHN